MQAYDGGEGSYRTLAKHFKVSVGAIQDLILLQRNTDSIEPKPHTGGKAHQKLFEHHYNDIEAWLTHDPNLFWREVADKLKDKYDLSIHPSQLSRQMKGRGYTRKKTRQWTLRSMTLRPKKKE